MLIRYPLLRNQNLTDRQQTTGKQNNSPHKNSKWWQGVGVGLGGGGGGGVAIIIFSEYKGRLVWGNRVDPDQMLQKQGIWSGATLFF